MRRPMIATVLAVTIMSLPDAANAQESRPQTKAEQGDGRSSVVVSRDEWSSPGQREANIERTGTRRGGRGRLPAHRLTRHGLERTAEGTRCLSSRTSRRDTPETPTEAGTRAIYQGYAANADLEGCPPAPGGSGVDAAPSPDEVAEAFVREIPLPAPAPSIAPNGTAITGLAAFVETNGSLGHTMGPSPTPLGPIVVEATSAYYVDWGDGTPETGPFAFEGEAFPHGRIWHHYRHRGDYTVTVRQAWSADWRLGPDAGTVGGLQTEASVALDVDEVQAVIRR